MRDGACLVDRMILGKSMPIQKGEIVFWDKFWGIEKTWMPQALPTL